MLAGISGPVRRGRRGIDVGDLVDQAEVVARLERQPAGQQVVHHHAQRIDVGAVIERVLLHLLRRHVGRRADRRDLGRVAAGDQRGAEVGDFHVGLAGVQDVRRLQVAVGDSHLVREIERAGALEDHLHHALDGQQALRVAVLLQRPAVDELHHDVVQLVLGDRIVDLADVRVRQLAGERGLGDEQLFEQLAARGVAENLLEHQLYRHVAAVERIVAQEHFAGRAFAELAHHAVFADVLPDRRLAHAVALRARRLRARATAARTLRGAVPPGWSRAATEPSSVSAR